jgi:hypothetical protein
MSRRRSRGRRCASAFPVETAPFDEPLVPDENALMGPDGKG